MRSGGEQAAQCACGAIGALGNPPASKDVHVRAPLASRPCRPAMRIWQWCTIVGTRSPPPASRHASLANATRAPSAFGGVASRPKPPQQPWQTRAMTCSAERERWRAPGRRRQPSGRMAARPPLGRDAGALDMALKSMPGPEGAPPSLPAAAAAGRRCCRRAPRCPLTQGRDAASQPPLQL